MANDKFKQVFLWTQKEDCVFSIQCVTFPPAVAVTGVACALMGESKLCLPVCHRQWITWAQGTTAARAWRRFTTLVHTLHLFCT